MTASSPTRPQLAMLPYQGEDMARRRLQQSGDLQAQGGWWRLRWREDTTGVIGYKKTGEPKYKRQWSQPVIVGPAPGNQNMRPLTKREAKRLAWDNFLSKLDQNNITPRSVATVAEFVEKRFRPDHLNLKRKNTRLLYDQILRNYVLPAIGAMRLRDVRREHVQRLASQVIAQGKSVGTVRHIIKVVSLIFSLAEDLEWNEGNPAKRIRLPESMPQVRAALTWPQVQQIAAVLDQPYSSMVVMLAQTGLRFGELAGLKWKWCNLSDQEITVDGYRIPPFAMLVKENWSAGEFQPSPKGKRLRQVPLTASAWVELMARWETSNAVGNYRSKPAPDQVVYPNRLGRPIDRSNFANEHFKPAVEKLGLSWASIHSLRHTMATMADQAKLTMRERMDLLGHRDERTAMGYAHSDLQRIREKLDEAENSVLRQSKTDKETLLQ
jgi:integrase